MVHACNAASATIVANHMKFGLTFDAAGENPTPIATVPNFALVKSALEDTYACLGITCAHVGALMNGAAPYAGAEACTHASATIAGYVPGSDVTQHNALDGDQAAMQTALKIPDFTAATTAYATGGSSTSKGKFRTLKGFSTAAKGKMYDGCPGCPYRHYKMFYDYYGDYDYADKWVSAALGGTDMTFSSGKFGPNNFATMHNDARVEAAKKGSAYMHVWMYAVREFEDAIDDCTSCVADCNAHSTNSGSVHAWDEGVAFYTGAREGTAHSSTRNGVMLYHLAQKRCKDFKTCGAAGGAADGISMVNSELFKAAGLFATGRDLLQQGHCAKVRPVVEQIVSLMTVPLVQGTLRYAYKVGNVAGDQSAKNAAEGSTFAATVLPMVNYCHAASATIVANHMKFGLTFDAAGENPTPIASVPDFAKVKSALEAVYPCLGITCAHVGALDGVISSQTATAAKCTDPTSSHIAWTPIVAAMAAKTPAAKIKGAKKVSVEVKAAGVVSDYDATKKAAVEAAMAKVAKVDANAVTVTVKAGSVILTFVIITDDPAAVKATVATALKDKALASTALGVTVEEVPTVAVVSVAAPKDDDGLSTGAVVGISVGAVVGLVLIGGIAFKVMSGKNVNPKEHSPA